MNELFSEERPWSHFDTKFSSEILNRVEAGERPLQNFSEVVYPHKPQIVDIINACWIHNAEERPDMTIILEMLDDLIESIENEKTLVRQQSTPNAYGTSTFCLPTAPTPSYTTVPTYTGQPPAYISSQAQSQVPYSSMAARNSEPDVPGYLRSLQYSSTLQAEEQKEQEEVPAYMRFN